MMQTASSIYDGYVLHRRLEPVEHVFRYRLCMIYIDLDELPTVFDLHPLWSARRPAIAWFRRADYLGPANVPLDQAVRDRIEQEFGVRPQGRIRLLTHARYCGYVFNPVSFYYVYDEAGEVLQYVVSEITNTPWGERHAYVVQTNGKSPAGARRFCKQFHVSPFMPMNLEYAWTFNAPGKNLSVHMENRKAGTVVFEARMQLNRHAWSRQALSRVLWRHPLMTARVMLAIHYQAFCLWLKRVPFHPHPSKKKVGERQSAAH